MRHRRVGAGRASAAVAAAAGAEGAEPLPHDPCCSFHNMNVLFREDDSAECVGFTAAQIPNIDGRRYPPELSGGRIGELLRQGIHRRLG